MNISSLGSEYGRHYASLELLHNQSLIYSFGIGQDITFDLELIDLTGSSIHAFDPTPKSIEWIERQRLPEKFKFYRYGLSDKDGLIPFSSPPNPDWVSYSEDPAGAFMFPVKRLETIRNELNHTGIIDFLKLDIEGSEYSVLNDILGSDLNPVQMSVEFHGRKEFIHDWIQSNCKLKSLYNIHPLPSNEFFFLLKSSDCRPSLQHRENISHNQSSGMPSLRFNQSLFGDDLTGTIQVGITDRMVSQRSPGLQPDPTTVGGPLMKHLKAPPHSSGSKECLRFLV